MKYCRHLCIAILLVPGASGCKKTPVVDRAAISAQQDGAAYIVTKLEKIVIPIIDFEDVSVEEAIDFLRMRSSDLEEGPPGMRGVSWIVKSRRVDAVDSNAGGLEAVEPNQLPKINYSAKEVGLLTAMKEIARQAHLDVYLTNVGIVMCPSGEPPLPVGKMDGEEVWKTIHKELAPQNKR